MKKLFATLLLLIAALTAAAQSPAFRFRDDGRFRILQLTDLHYTANEQQSGHVPAMLTKLIEREKPDLIVITGDLVYAAGPEKLLRHICGVIAKQDVPYAITLGNHDAEQGLTRSEIYDIVRTLPNCINGSYNPAGERQGDFVIPIAATNDPCGAALYIMDSNDYNANDHSYAGVDAEQVAWYVQQSKALEARYDRKVNSLVFTHIPLPEYPAAFDNDPHCVGFRLEKECPGRDNYGMFDAMVAQGDVTGVFAGHDHSNDYIATMQGIALGYGRYSGGFGEYQDLLSGARVIELRQDKRGFTTWVRLANGREVRKATFPRE